MMLKCETLVWFVVLGFDIVFQKIIDHVSIGKNRCLITANLEPTELKKKKIKKCIW